MWWPCGLPCRSGRKGTTMSASTPEELPEEKPGEKPAPEVWRLDHPRHGLLEVAVGGPEQLRTIDEGFPRRKKEEGEGAAGGAENVTNPGYVLLRDGGVVARAHQIGNHKVAITAEPPERGEFSGNLQAVSGPRVQLRSSAFATAVRQVTFREGKEIVHFDAPPGSAAEARLAAIAASPWKRVVYPVGAGLGKSGWAIAAILLVPFLIRFLERILDWIAERLPDFDLPWPDISLPSIPWPDITLPSINLPEISVPGWVEFLLEYSKVWVPLVIGIMLAVLAVRHSRRSRRTRELWAERRENERPDDERPDESGDPEDE